MASFIANLKDKDSPRTMGKVLIDAGATHTTVNKRIVSDLKIKPVGAGRSLVGRPRPRRPWLSTGEGASPPRTLERTECLNTVKACLDTLVGCWTSSAPSCGFCWVSFAILHP